MKIAEKTVENIISIKNKQRNWKEWVNKKTVFEDREGIKMFKNQKNCFVLTEAWYFMF